MNFINVLQEFNHKLFEQGKSLSDIGVEEYGWKYPEIIEVLDFCVKKKYLVLGGDVYSSSDNKFTITGDSWYISSAELSSGNENDRDKAVKYISDYHKRNGDAFIYVPVLNNKD